MALPQTNLSRGNDFFRELPVTKIIIGIWLLSFLSSILGFPLDTILAFAPNLLPNAITGLVTYSLAMGPNLINLFFGGFMLYQFGGSLERSWGWRTYLLFLLGASLASAVVWELGLWLVAGGLHALGTPWFLIAAVIVSWAWLNPEQTIMLWFVLPIKAKWIGWGTIALLFLTYPLSAVRPSLLVPVLGLFALGGVGFALAFDWYQRKWAWIPRRPRGRGRQQRQRPQRHPSSTFFGALTRPYREWQRRRRVAKLQRTFKLDD